ncbi:hypothetical protein [Salinibacterium sp.]|uniref:hypothetical protein n=2 Tax=Salinibacterium sp. TaxID=1915057 RepID=UPI00286D0165|nr:hypothetical protein [Salinibacterium sp.]
MRARRALLLGAAVAAVVGLALLVQLWFDGPVPREQTFAGFYTSDSDIRVTNLTINGGHIEVGYSVDVLVIPGGSATGIRCGMVDTSGRLDFFEASRTSAEAGNWTTLRFSANYDLPELTLGMRCSPNRSGQLTVIFRDAELHATPVSIAATP